MEIKYYNNRILKYEPQEDGGLLITGIKVMASGTWHASNAWTPMRYGDTVLKNDATNWKDTSLWSTHDQTRSITKKVGEVRNPRFQDNACMADLYLHGQTQESRDSITLITTNQIDSISAEIAIHEKTFCPLLEVDNASKIEFVGASLVSEGACNVCKLHSENENKEKLKMDAEIETKFTELVEKFAELTTKFEAMKIPEPVDIAPVQEELGASKETIILLNTTVSELTARIEKMEETPGEPKTYGGSSEKKTVNPFE